MRGGGAGRAWISPVDAPTPRRILLAIGVAPPETIQVLRMEVDDLVCITTPAHFAAVGQFYRDFRQVSDGEVIAMLARAADRTAAEKGTSRRA